MPEKIVISIRLGINGKRAWVVVIRVILNSQPLVTTRLSWLCRVHTCTAIWSNFRSMEHSDRASRNPSRRLTEVLAVGEIIYPALLDQQPLALAILPLKPWCISLSSSDQISAELRQVPVDALEKVIRGSSRWERAKLSDSVGRVVGKLDRVMSYYADGLLVRACRPESDTRAG